MSADALPPDLHALAVRERPFTVREYHVLGDAGILSEDDRIELIDGRLAAMSPIYPPHLATLNRLVDLLAERIYAVRPRPARLSVQNSIRLNNRSEPQPDLVLLRPEWPEHRTPTPADALLVVEVADTTVGYDRDIKRPRYAAAGVTELWIVLVKERAVEVYRRPEGNTYAESARLGPGDMLAVEALPARPPIPVGEAFPP